MNCNLVLEITDKYGKSVVHKMHTVPDGVYLIEKKGDRYGVCPYVEETKSPYLNVDLGANLEKTPEKAEPKPNKSLKPMKMKAGNNG